MKRMAMAQKTFDPSLSGACFSPCRTWRYGLWRRWGEGEDRLLMVIGLNPSTADETEDDPTIRRCIRFAKDWGHSGLIMVNLFAFRATDPEVMRRAADPIGPRNNLFLDVYAYSASLILAAWGVHGDYGGRAARVCQLLARPLHCLGKTKEGFPRHPLYVAAATKPVPFYTPPGGGQVSRRGAETQRGKGKE